MVRIHRLKLAPPGLQNSEGDVDRILAALRIKIFGSNEPVQNIHVPLDVIRHVGRRIRDSSYDVAAVVARGERGLILLDVRTGNESGCFGFAIDVGTTLVSFYLVDLNTGEVAARTASENPQAVIGEDVLTRIHFCQSEGGLRQLQELILGCINKNTSGLVQTAGIKMTDVYAVAVAGNPTMTHLLLGIDPYFLCREPYVPVFNQPLWLNAGEVGISVFPTAPVYLFPNLGSYFGGDVVAGILASGMYLDEDISILVDVGTNAEIVVGNRDWFMVCAGAAGPALESGGAKAGMRALPGAIEKVVIDPKTGEPTCTVIGGGRPRGICGSGLIDLVAQLYLSCLLDSNGRMSEPGRSRRIRSADGVRGYGLALADFGESDRDIVVDELDIRNLLRAKGAMYTALSLVMERLGLQFQHLSNFFVAGSFGEHINPHSAVTIGMLPDLPPESFTSIGNSAGLGACRILLSSGLRSAVEEICRKSTYLQLTTDGEFMDRLSASLFIPHTERQLFPSVRRCGS